MTLVTMKEMYFAKIVAIIEFWVFNKWHCKLQHYLCDFMLNSKGSLWKWFGAFGSFNGTNLIQWIVNAKRPFIGTNNSNQSLIKRSNCITFYLTIFSLKVNEIRKERLTKIDNVVDIVYLPVYAHHEAKVW